MGITIAYDVSGVDHDKTESGAPLGPVPPKGVYNCWVANIEQVEKAKVKGEFQLKFTFRIAGGAHANYPFFTYVDPTAESQKWKWDQILYALGIDTRKNEAGKFNSDTYVGKGAQAGKKTKVRVSIEHQTFTKEVNGEEVTSVSADVKGVYRFDPTKDEEYVDTGNAVGGHHNGDATTAQSDEEEYDLVELGELADAEDADSQAKLTELADAVGIDVNDYPTWGEVAEALSGSEASPDAADDDNVPEPEEEDDTDWSELGELADAEDEDSIALLTEKAEELGLDINDYPLWMDLANAIMEGGSEAEGEEEPSEAPDYDSMSDEELRAELEARGLRTSGPSSALKLRLRKDDGDPFAPKS